MHSIFLILRIKFEFKKIEFLILENEFLILKNLFYFRSKNTSNISYKEMGFNTKNHNKKFFLLYQKITTIF